MIGYRSYTATPSTIENKWYVVDAEGKVLGRLAAKIAHRLRGKHKPSFTPHMDCGDNIVVLNADKISVTGNKRKDKKYYRYTGYVGHLKVTSLERLLQRSPTKALELAIKGMLPRGPLGRSMFKKLRVYNTDSHNHESQNPQVLDI